MRKRHRLLIAGSVVLTAVVAAQLDLPHQTRAAAPRDRVILRLDGRDQQITVTSSPGGPRYSLALEGHLVADRLTLEELRMHYPAAYQQIESATAEGERPLMADIE